ncbi:hypothetical protein CKN82_00090 [Carnobacterium divergens]|uniref:5'-nucleotidase C-terminal domain-containing protein n=1 Tax=Carnobacterium divergens TaxID=2748 RepID=UPI00107169CC|nr:5'-nucleotidase C-terminal domain-containing protein [Carnobacterium divergens]MDT1997570.1 5'-nucleotidase C-terminal domain-containing protein [Carnobacterium divergens]TFI69700.1 hypothetical protein CKN59_00090 [Carnobacterium divergens]TFI69717.1 hypothetical protein CKN76_00090 [Carnobacterium divergens]TFI73744.1 hypothetical protein CKN70_00090 [Carnobacterium divergens]TFI84615.1 hypothetical protein CKN74_00090 [Carnobacterium divergens]
MKKASLLFSKVALLGLVVTSLGSFSAIVSADEIGGTDTGAVTQAPTATLPIQLLGINDFHGALSTTGTAYINGTPFRNAGKAALLATYLDQAEETFKETNATGSTIRVQAGDMVGASPANSGLLQDEPTIKVLNRMNFQVGTLGNHEFDEGLAEYNRILTGTAPLPGQFNQITQNYQREASKTDIVIANMTDKETGAIPFDWKPYTTKLISKNGQSVEVGFIGIVTTEIPNLVLKKHYEQYNFLDEAETVAKYSKELRDKGVNAIVVLAHVPATSDKDIAIGDAATLINNVNTIDPENSVDALFAGHNHQFTNGLANNTRIVQSTSQGKAFVNMTGELDPVTKDFVKTPDAVVTPVLTNDSTGAPVVPHSAVSQIIEEADNLVTQVTNEKVGTATEAGTMSREVNAANESPVGNLVTDAQRIVANLDGNHVDFAMTNNGGIRADLLVQDDKTITWGAAQNVQPFGNILQIVEMTGAQIENVLNEQYDEDGKYFLQLSGLRYTYTETDDPTVPYKVHQIVKENGEPLDPNGTYRVVINDFLFGGGDGFKTFTGAKLIGAIDSDTDTFINYFKAQEAAGKTISAAVDGRKTYRSQADIAAENEKNALAAIHAATVLTDIKEKDTQHTGKTLPNATISVQVKETVQTRSLNPATAIADANGDFTVDISSLDVKKDQVLVVTVTDQNGYSVPFEKTVLAMDVVTPKPDENGGTPPVTPEKPGKTDEDKPVTTDKTSSKKDGKDFPQTGENVQLIGAIVGASLLGGGIVLVLRKKKIV